MATGDVYEPSQEYITEQMLHERYLNSAPHSTTLASRRHRPKICQAGAT